MKTIIISGGTINDPSLIRRYINDDSYVICADSGLDKANEIGLKPDLCIGDMDSVKSSLNGQNVEVYPKEKDYTDTELAVMVAIDKGSDEIIMIGCTGTRLDHTLANIMLLKTLVDKGIKCLLVDSHNIMALCNSTITLFASPGQLCSLVPITECTGVTTNGLLYPLNDERLPLGSSRGVSNVFSVEMAKIELKSGYLLVIRSTD